MDAIFSGERYNNKSTPYIFCLVRPRSITMPSLNLKLPKVTIDWVKVSSFNLPAGLSGLIDEIAPTVPAKLESFFQTPLKLEIPAPVVALMPPMINLSDFNLPDFNLPDFDLGDFDLGDFDLGDFDLGDFDRLLSPNLQNQLSQFVETAYQYAQVNYPTLVTQVQAQVQQIAKNLPNLNFANPLTIKPSGVSLSQRFDELIVFGDSLSDIGNLFQARGPAFLPQGAVNGRFSNGDLWVDYLAPQLGLTGDKIQNFAFGGATSGRVNIGNAVPLPFPLPALPGLLDQIDTAKAKLSPATKANPKALYVVWAGANDFLTLPTDTTAAVQAVVESVKNIAKSVTSLAELGAKTIAVTNLPNIGLTPLAAERNLQTQATIFSTVFNTLLQGTLGALEANLGVDLVQVDAFSLVQSIATRPNEFGLSNIKTPLFDQNPPPANPDAFAFADDFHPTTAVHRFVADTFKRSLSSPTPGQVLPSTIDTLEQLVNSSGLRSRLNQLLDDVLPSNAKAAIGASMSGASAYASAATSVFANI
jgi:phospholipase/lecithinase/hemolysin